MMVIENEYEIGSFVYIKSDPDQLRRQVVAIIVCEAALIYKLACGGSETGHYAFELTKEPEEEWAEK